MTTRDVFEALLAGKRVRREIWKPSSYLFLDSKGNLKYQQVNKVMPGNICQYFDYEICEESKG